MKKVFSIVKVIAILFITMLIITGCSNKTVNPNNNFVDPDKIEIENKLKSIQADAIIMRTFMGGDCSEEFEYHICYDSLKIYEYKIFSYYPMTDGTNQNTIKKTHTYTLTEYDISKNQMEEIRQVIVKEENNKKTEGRYNDYKLKIGSETYYIEDSKTMYEILNKIR